MGVKINQLKKFSVKQLKDIVKSNNLGKITKKKKAQLIGLISNCDECKNILSKLSLPLKKAKKPASAKQLAARAKFKAMVQGKKKDKSKPINKQEDKSEFEERIRLGSKPTSELKDIALDKGLKFPSFIDHEDLVKMIMFGKPNLKNLQQKDLEIRQTKPVEKSIVKEAKKEIKDTMETLIEKNVILPIGNKKQLEKIGKKAFLDGIFGVSKFSLRKEIKDIVQEASEEQLEIFLSFSKAKKKLILEKRFNTSKSIGQLIKTFIK